MRLAFLVPLLAGLAACAAIGDGRGLPSRNEAAAAMLSWIGCTDQAARFQCPPPPRRVILHGLQCRRDPDREHPSRVLCRFSPEYVEAEGRRRHGAQCLYLRRGIGRWFILNVPDADACMDPQLGRTAGR